MTGKKCRFEHVHKAFHILPDGGFLPVIALQDTLDEMTLKGWELVSFCEAKGGFAVLMRQTQFTPIEE